MTTKTQQAFFKAYSLDNANPDYLYNLAVSLDNMGKHSAAFPFYQQVEQLDMKTFLLNGY